jgi:adenosylcobinamide-GDP ribazoletransferase
MAEFASQIRFFSRLPVPRLGPADDPANPPPFARAIRMLPVAGMVIWAPASALVALSSFTELSSLAVAALAVILTTVLTGAFHEDGLADIADGFGGGFTVERRLEIMKDSRIGAFGGIALAAQFVLRTVLIADLIDGTSEVEAALALLGVAALARPASLVLMRALAPARPDGLARAAGQPEKPALTIALALAALVFVAATAPTSGLLASLAAPALAIAALAVFAAQAKAKVGGYTGDVIGAGTLIAEMALLVGLTAV